MDTTRPAHPTLGCLLHLLPALTASQHFCLGISVSCGPGSSLLSLPLWIPGHSLPGDVAGWLPEGVANPTLGLPLLLFPCGFQVRACLVMLLAGFLMVCLCAMCSWVSPLLLFPCGFQVRACLLMLLVGFLMVWPIQLHFLLRICAATGSWSAVFHRSSFLIFSCHRIQRILCRQLLMKVWN